MLSAIDPSLPATARHARRPVLAAALIGCLVPLLTGSLGSLGAVVRGIAWGLGWEAGPEAGVLPWSGRVLVIVLAAPVALAASLLAWWLRPRCWPVLTVLATGVGLAVTLWRRVDVGSWGQVQAVTPAAGALLLVGVAGGVVELVHHGRRATAAAVTGAVVATLTWTQLAGFGLALGVLPDLRDEELSWVRTATALLGVVAAVTAWRLRPDREPVRAPDHDREPEPSAGVAAGRPRPRVLVAGLLAAAAPLVVGGLRPSTLARLLGVVEGGLQRHPWVAASLLGGLLLALALCLAAVAGWRSGLATVLVAPALVGGLPPMALGMLGIPDGSLLALGGVLGVGVGAAVACRAPRAGLAALLCLLTAAVAVVLAGPGARREPGWPQVVSPPVHWDRFALLVLATATVVVAGAAVLGAVARPTELPVLLGPVLLAVAMSGPLVLRAADALPLPAAAAPLDRVRVVVLCLPLVLAAGGLAMLALGRRAVRAGLLAESEPL